VTPRRRGDGGVGMVSSVAGFLVFVLFLMLAVQVLYGLYATSTVRATLLDAASRAASSAVPAGAGRGGGGVELRRVAEEAEASLGEMGERTTIVLRVEDDDGDGLGDVVVGDAVAVPPRFVPPSIGGMVGFEQVRASVRVRIERPR
jgi:hypothetical protein